MRPEVRRVYVFCNQRDVNDATRHYLKLLRTGLALADFQDLGMGADPALAAQASDLLTLSVPFAFRAMRHNPEARLHHWFQGLEALERQYLHGGAKGWLQRQLFEQVESRILRRACSLLMVSEAMRDFLKQRVAELPPTWVMPCYNGSLLPAVGPQNRYAQADLVYAGSLHRWQCVPKVLEVYRCMLKARSDARLTLYTREEAAARALCADAGLADRVRVTQCTPEALSLVLQRHAYGLILREPMPINTVSTPTKFSAYLAAGVIPVLTSATPELVRLAGIAGEGIVLPGAAANAAAIATAIQSRCLAAPSVNEVHARFAKVFATAFNDAHNAQALAHFYRDVVC